MKDADTETSDSRTMNVVLVGDSGVGKTALIQTLTGQQFVPTESTPAESVHTFGAGRETLIVDLDATISRDEQADRVHKLDPAVAVVVADAFNESLHEYVQRW